VTKRIAISQHSFLHNICQQFQVLHHLKSSTRGHHLVRCSRPSEWRTLLTRETIVCCSSNKTIRRQWFNGGVLWIVVLKHLWENPFIRGTSFAKTGCICAENNNSGRRPSDETVEPVRESLLRNLQKSTRQAGRELDDVSRMPVCRVLHKRLSFRPYKIQLLQEFKHSDRPYRTVFWTDMLKRLE
jgi:hypothetical protein